MIYYIENEYLKIGVKTLGAELTSIKSKSTGNEYLWQGDPNVWSGQSPILFPVIGRVLDDKYRLDGKEYTMPKHGLFRKRETELLSLTETEMIFAQKSDDDTLSIFPFLFEIHIKFELIGKSVKVTHTVINNDNKTMYFSIGAHPAFNCEIGDYLVFEKNETLDTIEIDSECLRTGKMLPVLNENNKIVITKDIFNNDALIFGSMKSKYVTLESNRRPEKIKFNYSDCAYLGIWAKPGASYVCIEPWWGINDSHERKDDFSEKDSILSITANSDFSCFWQAEIFE